MSVVNKMLRDLDNREYVKSFNAKSANYVPPRSSKALWSIIACLTVFCIVAASYSVYLVNQEAPSRPSGDSQNIDLEKGDQYASIDSLTTPVSNADSYREQSLHSAQAFLPKPGEEIMLGYASAVPSTQNEVKVNTRTVEPGNMKVAPSDGSQATLSTLRARAHIASEQNNDAEVVRLLKQILVLAPQETRTRKQLAALLFSKNQLTEAQQVLDKGIRFTPADSSMRLMQSRILFKLGDNESAFKVLAGHPYDSLANDELVSFRAALAEKIGLYGAAQQDYQILVQRNPSDAKWWLGLGVSQDKQKLNKQAITSYQQAQALNQLPQNVDSFVAERIKLLTGR